MTPAEAWLTVGVTILGALIGSAVPLVFALAKFSARWGSMETRLTVVEREVKEIKRQTAPGGSYTAGPDAPV